MKVTRILIQAEKLIILFDHIGENEELSFVLRHRKTKDVVPVKSIQDNKNNELKLEYKNVELPEVEFARYDLLVATEEKLIRPKVNNKKLSLKNINSDVFYFTSNYYGFRFYLTRDNEVSVCRGNYITVEKEFKQVRKIDVPVTEIEYSGIRLRLTIPFEIQSSSSFVTWKDTKGNYILQTGANLQENEHSTSINIDKQAFDSISDMRKLTPLIVFVKDSILYEGILKTSVVASDKQIGNQIGVYTYSNSGILKITQNLNLYMRKVLRVEKQPLFVQEYSFSSQVVTIALKERFDFTNSLIFKEDIANRRFELIKDFTVKGAKIRIPIDSYAMGQKRFRYVFLKKYQDDFNHGTSELPSDNINIDEVALSAYQYFGLSKENFNQNSPKSERYSDYIQIDNDLCLYSYWSANGDLVFKTGTLDDYRNKRYEECKVNFSGINFEESYGQIEFQLETIDLNLTKALNFYLVARKTEKRFDVPYLVKGSQTIILDFSTFLDNLELEWSRWDMFMEVYQQESYLHGKLGMFSSSVQNKFERYLSPISSKENKNNFCLVPYFSVKNELAFIWNDIDKIHNEQLEHDIKVTSSKVTASMIEIETEVSISEVSEFKVDSGMIKLRNKALLREYAIPVEVLFKSDEKATLRLKIDPAKYHLLPFYWDIYVVLLIGGDKFPLRLKNPPKKLKRKISKQISHNEINLADDYMIYPYITIDNSYALCYRKRQPYENKINRFKENLAYIFYRLFKKYFDKKKIWIGYEKESSVAQDNGYQFFNYCYTNNKKKDYYFVIKPDVSDYQDIKHQNDKILKFMSFKYMVYMFAAELLVSSESKGHSYDIRIQKGRLRNALKKKPFIFLQHGVIALKRVDYVFNKHRNNEISLFTVSSDFEKNIIQNNFGYDASEIMVTGLTRWDVLNDKSSGPEKKIFVMPTWRSWMDGIPEKEFVNSNYFKQYKKLLESEELNKLLEQNNLTLHFMLHPKFSAYSDKFTFPSDRIRTYQFGDVKINEMLMESALLITDYSSVSFEFFYMKKPIIFFQFDRDEYERYQGSYMDLEKDLFGDLATNIDEILDNVRYYVANGFKEKTKYAVLRNKYFKYVDRNNSKRTFHAVRKYEKNLTKNRDK